MRHWPLRERTSGPQASLTGTIVGNIAFLADEQGLWTQAQLLYQRALVVQQAQLGLHHPTVGLLVERYARVLDTLGQPVEAGLFAARAHRSGRGFSLESCGRARPCARGLRSENSRDRE